MRYYLTEYLLEWLYWIVFHHLMNLHLSGQRSCFCSFNFGFLSPTNSAFKRSVYKQQLLRIWLWKGSHHTKDLLLYRVLSLLDMFWIFSLLYCISLVPSQITYSWCSEFLVERKGSYDFSFHITLAFILKFYFTFTSWSNNVLSCPIVSIVLWVICHPAILAQSGEV